MNRKFKSNSGSVLIITLVFLVLMTILIVGAANLMSLSRSAAHTHLEKTRAALFADSGVQQVIATLQQATTDSNRYWVSQPGQLWTGNSVDNSSTSNDDRLVLQTTPILLSSGEPSASAPTDVTLFPCNLNIPSMSDTNQYFVSNDQDASGARIKMNVDWVYVRNSGALDTNEAPSTVNALDPIVGRYAYWADDESGRINCNLAWGRAGNTNVVPTPTMIDSSALTNFTSSMATQMHQFVTTNNYQTIGSLFNTPEDARRVNLNVSEILSTNLFHVTHYNSDPGLGLFYSSGASSDFYQGRPILLTTNPNLVPKNADGSYAYRFLDILLANKTDPGLLADIDYTKLSTILHMLIDCFASTNWPMAPGSSFQQKYYSYDTSNTRYLQLALNLIDYVRCRETSQALVSPLRAAWAPNGMLDCAYLDYGNFLYQTSFIGLGRTPCINELGISVTSTKVPVPGSVPPTTAYMAQVVIELYLPPNYGLQSVDLTKCGFFVQIFNGSQVGVQNQSVIGTTATASPSTTLNAGGYATITTQAIALTGYTTRPNSLKLRAVLTGPADKLDIVPAAEYATTDSGVDSSTAIVIPIDSPGTAVSSITSTEVDDPRVNKSKNNWVARASGNTFGAPNSILSVGSAPLGVVPQQDTDASGKVSSASLYMPPPKGTSFTRSDGTKDDNTLGIMTSVAELGYLLTGNESGMLTQGGIPWRTLRLQPSTQSSSVVPDWALLGLFAIPTIVPTAAQSVFTPHGTSVGGRVNINAMCQPFSFPRLYPLAGVLQGAQNQMGSPSSTVSTSMAQTLASNIATHVLATNGKNYNFPSAYYLPGEIAEIAGVADQGEASEQLLRQSVDLLTVRGNVFRVYSVGQAIQQTPGGTLKVTGEQRTQVLLERWLDGSTSSSTYTGALKFKTLYYGVLSR